MCIQSTVIAITKSNTLLIINIGGHVVKCLTYQTSNLRIASHIGSNPVRGKLVSCFLEQETTLIAQYWLVPGTGSRVSISLQLSTQPN